MGSLITLMVPTQNSMELRPIVNRVTRMWNGAYGIPVDGYWMSTRAGIVQEPCTMVCASVGELDTVAQDWWTDLAQSIARTYNQECVYWTDSDNGAYLTDQKGHTVIIGENE